MVGEIEPLNDIEDENTQRQIIERIFEKYPTRTIEKSHTFYRIRKSPKSPEAGHEYDSPPIEFNQGGRLNNKSFPALYASEDLDLCLHECLVTAEDDIYLATLTPSNYLKMLDLTALIKEENITEFESLDLIVHFLFLAASHAYPITQKIALAAKENGFDGIIYPSYFSLLRLGIMPFKTTCVISNRIIPEYQNHGQQSAIASAAIFVHPIADGKLRLQCINRLVLSKVTYDVKFGPVRD